MSEPLLLAPVPEVECLGCGRTASCLRVANGTVYRPFAWLFSYPPQPRLGWCPACREAHERSCTTNLGAHNPVAAGEGCLGCDVLDGTAVHPVPS